MRSAWGQLPGIVVAAVLGGASSAGVLAQPAVRLTPGMVITRSVRIAPGTYRLAAPPSMDSALIHVRGRGITVELRDVTIIGASEDSPPDAAAGVALRIDGGARVTVRGGTIRGFKVAILARATRDLRLIDADVSHNWKPRMYSLVEHESLVDWLSYHHNEQNEWLRYGAAIYLDGVHGGEVRGVRAEQGMNGLMMARTDSVLVWNSTFSYNSGVGIGLYRAIQCQCDHVIVAAQLPIGHGLAQRVDQRPGERFGGLVELAASKHAISAHQRGASQPEPGRLGLLVACTLKHETGARREPIRARTVLKRRAFD